MDRGHRSAILKALPFHAVNRRGEAGFDSGLQRHHLLPRQVLGRSGFADFFASLGVERTGFHDFRRNGILLPSHDGTAMRMGLPLHRGPHRSYNALVLERVGQIETGWLARRGHAPASAREEALMRLALLQRALRRRLLDPLGRRFVLNRRDPFGVRVNFSDLDAMADLLWSETDA